MESEQLQRAIEAILFAAGERIDIVRLAAALETDASDVEKAADELADKYAFERRGIRILKLEKGYQMVSSGEMADYVTKALETRKPPKLSSSQLETLTIIAYYQPATKAMVEQIRGVDSAYSVAALLNKKLIEENGITIIRMEQVDELGIDKVMQRARAIVGEQPTYISFDIDVLDPVYAPGTGTPEIGGMTTLQAQRCVRQLAGLNLIGADVVEVSPPFDQGNLTSLTGATMMFELLCQLADAHHWRISL